MQRDAALICAAYGARVWRVAHRHHIHEGLVCIAFFVELLHVHVLRQTRVQGRVDTADHRREMRYECQADFLPSGLSQSLYNSRRVPMPGHVVSLEVIGRFREKYMNFGLAAGPADTGLRVGDQVTRVDYTCL